ncbi:alpha/beta fold hydrolase [Streptomyces echinatus]|uniref:Pimeloyl-ACP methyl ester carboxylesterase n=2 Tax=Streptomyces echinatus TaxID=67293 RepID=A0A7W9Q331_9ACTN|nr:alpha/beta hydrolase [Streptomyces echinatus]MBB5931977.1 pimeloyl-ACP methyl ester carboxylesterase [Streptomyces echinatus]
MATFILVPGGWHGGWHYSGLADRLRAAGHRALPVTLTGLGDRAHLSGPAVNLETHIEDVLAVLASEQVSDAVLVGHSYAGMVITGVADRAAPGLVRRLVYSDAYVPENGQSCWELTTEAFRQIFLSGAAADGFSVQPPPGLDPRTTAHPLASFLQRLRLTGDGLGRIATRDYVYLSGWTGTPFTELHERLAKDPEWRTHVLDCSHNVVRDALDDFQRILLLDE